MRSPLERDSNVLEGVVVYVSVENAGGLNASAAFAKQLSAAGARVVARLNKDVTHVVFKGQPANLRALYDRLAKVAPVPATVVGVGWVSSSQQEGRRALERPHVLPRPADPPLAFLQTPASKGKTPSAAHGTKRRRSMQPKHAESFDVNTLSPVFSSSQQLANPATTAGGSSSSGPPRRKRRFVAQGGGDASARGATPPTPRDATFSAESTPHTALKAPSPQDSSGKLPNQSPEVRKLELATPETDGRDKTQQSGADDRQSPLLPVHQLPAIGKQAPSPCKPLQVASETLSRSGRSLRRRPRVRWSDEQAVEEGLLHCAAPPLQEASGEGGGGGSALTREASDCRTEAERRAERAQDVEGVCETPSPQQLRLPDQDVQEVPDTPPHQGQAAEHAETVECSLLKVAAASPDEVPETPPPAADLNSDPPEPDEPRVRLALGASLEIWWNGDEVFYPCTVTGYNEAAACHQVLYNDGEVDELDLSKEKYKLTGGSNVELQRDARAKENFPIAATAAPEVINNHSETNKLDLSKEQNTLTGGSKDHQVIPDGRTSTTLPQSDEKASTQVQDQDSSPETPSLSNVTSCPRRPAIAQMENPKLSKMESPELVTTPKTTLAVGHGLLGSSKSAGKLPKRVVAVSSVETAVEDVLRAMALQHKQVSLLLDSTETANAQARGAGKMTHLVLGEKRRTMKLLMAIANGAWVVSPEWCYACLQAERWVEESAYECDHYPGITTSRKQHTSDNFVPLLHGHSIFLEPCSQLKALVQALGGSLARTQSTASICILKKGGRPRGLNLQVPVVREEWLLQATVNYALPDMYEWCI